MRILVTGVTGVIGRAVARQLVAAGHEVSGIARYPHDRLDREVDLVCAPLGGPVLQQLADEAHVVLHLARSIPPHPAARESTASCTSRTRPPAPGPGWFSYPRRPASPSCTGRPPARLDGLPYGGHPAAR